MRLPTFLQLALALSLLSAAACSRQEATAAEPAATEAALAAPAAEPAAAPSNPDGPDSIPVPDLAYSDKAEDIAKGEQIFTSKGCAACHKIGGGRLVGPDLAGVTKRKSAKWIGRMILKPEEMLRSDDQAKALFKEYMTPMGNQNIQPDSELPALLAFLKSKE